MSGSLYLAAQHARRRPARTLILIACLAIVATIPIISRALASRFEATLHARADGVPAIVGASGSRFDLVFSALYFRSTRIGVIRMRDYEELLREPGVRAIPLHARFSARGAPIVATSIEYLEWRALRVTQGDLFTRLGECVVGASAARRLGLSPGDTIDSDQLKQYDITAPPSIRLRVAGVLGPIDTPDDDAIFVDLETAWVLEGAAHGHQDAAEVSRDDLVIARSDSHVALSEALVTRQEITPENEASFHVHGDRADLPLTGVLLFPDNAKTDTIVRTRLNARPGVQALVPSEVVDELVDYVVRIRRVLDLIALILGVSTVALIALIVALAVRVRAPEVRTLAEIGAARSAVLAIFAWELLIQMFVAFALAVGASVLVVAIASGASHML